MQERPSFVRCPAARGKIARIALLIGAVALGGCGDPMVEMTPTDLCDQVAIAVSNRTLSCTGDTELANQRYHEFHSGVACIANADWVKNGPSSQVVGCVVHCNTLPCSQVDQYGADFAKWLADDIYCGMTVQAVSTTGGGNDAGPDATGEACVEISTAFLARLEACATSPEYLAYVKQLYSDTIVCSPASQDCSPRNCLDGIAQVSCDWFQSLGTDLPEFFTNTVNCSSFMVAR